jgi:hypothetical protein
LRLALVQTTTNTIKYDEIVLSFIKQETFKSLWSGVVPYLLLCLIFSYTNYPVSPSSGDPPSLENDTMLPCTTSRCRGGSRDIFWEGGRVPQLRVVFQRGGGCCITINFDFKRGSLSLKMCYFYPILQTFSMEMRKRIPKPPFLDPLMRYV